MCTSVVSCVNCFKFIPKDPCITVPKRLELGKMPQAKMNYSFYAEILVSKEDPKDATLTEVYRCFGTIIHKYLIVTEAECMYQENNTLPAAKSIFIEMGLQRERSQASGNTSVSVYMCDLIWCHPDFNVNVLKTKPDDHATLMKNVCLLRVNGHVDFTETITPALLPSSQFDPLAGQRLFRPVSYFDKRDKSMTYLKDYNYRAISPAKCTKGIAKLNRHIKALPNANDLICAAKDVQNNRMRCGKKKTRFSHRFGHLYSRVNESIVLVGFLYRHRAIDCHRTGNIFYRISPLVDWILASSKMLKPSCQAELPPHVSDMMKQQNKKNETV